MTTMTAESLPPGPDEPQEEQLSRFFDDPYGYLEELGREHGTMFTLRLGAVGNEDLAETENNGSWVFLCRPDQVRRMYAAPGEVASGAVANAIFFGTNEKSVAYIDGDAHRQRRSQIQPAFSAAADYTELIERTARSRMADWPVGERFQLFPELQRLTSEVIVEVMCGNLPEADRRELSSMLPRTENARYSRAEIIAADRTIRGHLESLIDDHLARASRCPHQDVFADLLTLRDGGDSSLTREVVRDEVFSLLYTGFSTTANTLSWALARIFTDPTAHKKLMDELGGSVTPQGPVSKETLTGLRYLDAVITETLRLHPVTPLNGVRMLTRPMELDGHLLPAGTILVHCAYLLQRSEEVYERPLEFLPERFLDGPPQGYTWGAFGGGNRMCLGRTYSRQEMRVILAVLLSNRMLEIPGGLVPARLQGFFMAPEDGLECVVRHR